MGHCALIFPTSKTCSTETSILLSSPSILPPLHPSRIPIHTFQTTLFTHSSNWSHQNLLWRSSLIPQLHPLFPTFPLFHPTYSSRYLRDLSCLQLNSTPSYFPNPRLPSFRRTRNICDLIDRSIFLSSIPSSLRCVPCSRSASTAAFHHQHHILHQIKPAHPLHSKLFVLHFS